MVNVISVLLIFLMGHTKGHEVKRKMNLKIENTLTAFFVVFVVILISEVFYGLGKQKSIDNGS